MDLAARVRRGIELFNRRDWEAIARGLPDDFEAIDRVPPDERRVIGPGGLRSITLAAGDSAFSGLSFELAEITEFERGDGIVDVLARVVARASGGTSSVPLESEIGQIWTFENGTPRRFEQFRSYAEAREALGP